MVSLRERAEPSVGARSIADHARSLLIGGGGWAYPNSRDEVALLIDAFAAERVSAPLVDDDLRTATEAIFKYFNDGFIHTWVTRARCQDAALAALIAVRDARTASAPIIGATATLQERDHLEGASQKHSEDQT